MGRGGNVQHVSGSTDGNGKPCNAPERTIPLGARSLVASDLHIVHTGTRALQIAQRDRQDTVTALCLPHDLPVTSQHFSGVRDPAFTKGATHPA